MSKADAQRYNLVFAGQLLPGTDRSRAQRTLAAFFGIDDPAAVAPFFSGKPVPLRRNLRHEDALQLYRQLRAVGLICEVPRSTGSPTPAPTRPEQPAKPATPPAAQGAKPRDRAARADTARRTTRVAKGPAPAELAALEAHHRETLARRNPLAVPAGREALVADPAPARPRPPPMPPAPAVAPPAAREAAAPESPRGKAPNQFALRPALQHREGERLRETLQVRALVAAAVAATLCVIIVAVTLRFPAAPAGPEPRGPLAAAGREGGELIMLLPRALLLHARSGLPRKRVAATELGLEELAAPLLPTADGSLIVAGRAPREDMRLLRCDLEALRCDTLLGPGEISWPVALTQSYLGDTLFLLFADGRLLRASESGEITNEAATAPSPGRPVLRYVDGLLLLPAPDGPLVGVHRPDRERFGEQLDALFLAATDATGSIATRAQDVAMAGDARWAILVSESGERGLYRFDRQWGSAERIAVAVREGAYLVPWRDRLLIADAGAGSAQRIGPDGRIDADFVSELLAQEREDWLQLMQQRALLRRVGVVVPVLLAALAAGLALLSATAAAGLSALAPVSTKLLDPMPAGVHWLPAASAPARRAARIGLLPLAVALVPTGLLLAVGAWLQALCLLPAVLAGLYARVAMTRGFGGHLGLRRGDAIVVDHDGRYFYGEKATLRQFGGLLFAPGVVLPLAVAGLHDTDSRALPPVGTPGLSGTAAAGLLWQSRHPWFLAIVATLAGWLLSIAALALAA